MELKFLLGIFMLCMFEETRAYEYITLVAKPYVYFNKTFNVHLATSELLQETDIVLSFRGGLFSIPISDGTNPKTELFEFAAKDQLIFSPDNKIPVTPLTLTVHRNGLCLSQTAEITDTLHKFYTFIQLNKPVYKPGDLIQYRVVAFDSETKPVKIDNIQIILEDNTGAKLGEQNHPCSGKKSEFGLYNNTFQIRKDVNLGMWSISVKINNGFEVKKYFPVEEYELPLYELKVEHPKIVYVSEKSFLVKIFAKYRFGTYANGMAKMIIKDLTSDKTTEFTELRVKKQRIVNITLQRDFSFQTLSEPREFNIHVNFTDDATKVVQTVESSFIIKKSKAMEIQFIGNSKFIPGFPYSIKLCVTNKNGQKIVRPNSDVTLSGDSYDGMYYEELENDSRPLDAAEILFSVKTNEKMNRLDLLFKFEDIEVTKTVEKDSKISNELKLIASIQNSRIENNVKVEIYGSVELGLINVLVFGKFGIAHVEKKDCLFSKSCTVYFKATLEMKPEAKIVVYKVSKLNDEIMVGSTKITFDEFSNNTLKLHLSSTKAEYHTEFSYTLESLQNSYVAVLAIDKSLKFKYESQDITHAEIIKELTGQSDFYIPDTTSKGVFYDKSNENYIINLKLTKWVQCNDEELEKINSIIPYTGRLNNIVSYRETAEQPRRLITRKKSNEGQIRKYFPETWIWDIKFFDNNAKHTFNEIVPDTMTTWLFTAFSINQVHGFDIAKPQELEVSQSFFVELNVPFTMRLGEFVRLDMIIFNYVKEQVNNYKAKITIFVHSNGEAQFKMATLDGSTGSCIVQYSKDTENNFEISPKHNDGTQFDSMYIEGIRNGPMKIRVKVEMKIGSKTYEDTIEKEVEVINEGVPQLREEKRDFHHSEYDEKNKKVSFNINAKINVINSEMTALIDDHGEGPIISFDDNFIMKNYRIDDGEMICSKYARTLYLLEYLNKTGLSNQKLRSIANEKLSAGYQNLMRYKKIDGGFHTFFSTNVSTMGSSWMAAYVANVLGHALKFKKELGIKHYIDKNIIGNALDYCVNKQRDDGSFPELGFSKIPAAPLEKSVESRKARYTCFVLIALIKNNEFFYNKYSPYIYKGFSFIFDAINTDNYYAAVCAYAFALNGTVETARALLKSLEKSAESDGEIKYWDLEKGNRTAINTKVLIASYIALAYLQTNDREKYIAIKKWLIKNRNLNGNFPGTHSTAVAYQAYSAMGRYVSPKNTVMNIDFIFNSQTTIRHEVTYKNIKEQNLIYLPKNYTSNFIVRATGTGYVQVLFQYLYYQNIEQSSNFIDLRLEKRHTDIENVKEIRVHAKQKAKFEGIEKDEKDNRVILSFVLPSGYIYMAEKTDPINKIVPSGIVERVESSRAKTILKIVLKNITEYTVLKVYIQKVHEVKNLKKGSVKIHYENEATTTFTTRFFDIESSSCVD